MAEAGFGTPETLESFGSFQDAIQGALFSQDPQQQQQQQQQQAASSTGSYGTPAQHSPHEPMSTGYPMFTSSRDEKVDMFRGGNDSNEHSPSPTETKFSSTLHSGVPFSNENNGQMSAYSAYPISSQAQFTGLDNQEFFQRHSAAAFPSFPGQPDAMATYGDQKDSALFSSGGINQSQRTSAHYGGGDSRGGGGGGNQNYPSCTGFYDNRMAMSPDSNFNIPSPFATSHHHQAAAAAHMYRSDFNLHLAAAARQGGYHPRNLSLAIGGCTLQDMELAKYHMQSPTTPSTPTSTRSSPSGDMVDALPPPKMKETMLCAVCGDNAACQHYGVRTCEGEFLWGFGSGAFYCLIVALAHFN